MPVIGISCCLDARGAWREGRSYHYIDAAYARAVEDAGGLPVYLPVQRDAKQALSQVDGLIVPGGDDLLPPAPYPDGVVFEPVPEEQLAFDRTLVRAALERELPVLGICYGMQVLAVECGGTLHYDLGTDLTEATAHKLADAERHEIRIDEGTQLARLVGSARASVNSAHHQAVSEPGDELRVCSRAPDGVIEAIEGTGSAFRMGVQWHPEQLGDATSRALFHALVKACDGGR